MNNSNNNNICLGSMEAEMNLKILFLKTQHAAWRHVHLTNTALSWVQNVCILSHLIHFIFAPLLNYVEVLKCVLVVLLGFERLINSNLDVCVLMIHKIICIKITLKMFFVAVFFFFASDCTYCVSLTSLTFTEIEKSSQVHKKKKGLWIHTPAKYLNIHLTIWVFQNQQM